MSVEEHAVCYLVAKIDINTGNVRAINQYSEACPTLDGAIPAVIHSFKRDTYEQARQAAKQWLEGLHLRWLG